MIAVDKAEVSAMAPFAALVVCFEKRRMMALATGAAINRTSDRIQSLRNITAAAPRVIRRFCV